jgi:hypothetical protein
MYFVGQSRSKERPKYEGSQIGREDYEKVLDSLPRFRDLAVACAAGLTAPSANAVQPHGNGLVVLFDFSTGSQGWLPDFSDYPLEIADLDRLAEIRQLPKEVQGGEELYYHKIALTLKPVS